MDSKNCRGGTRPGAATTNIKLANTTANQRTVDTDKLQIFADINSICRDISRASQLFTVSLMGASGMRKTQARRGARLVPGDI